MYSYPTGATGAFTTASFSSMADQMPDKGYQIERSYNTINFESEAGYEKRRLRSRRAKRIYTLNYTNITGLQRGAIESFYNARSGEYEAFIFDLSHVNDSGNITVRFSGPLQVNHVFSAAANVLQNYYTVSFKLQETYG